MGSKVRNFPFRLGIMCDYSTSFSELVRNGFMLVPDAIQTTNTTLSVNRDAYLNQLRNLNWGGTKVFVDQMRNMNYQV